VKKNFDILLTEEATAFVRSLSLKAQKKIAYNLQKSREVKDSKILKKLNEDI